MTKESNQVNFFRYLFSSFWKSDTVTPVFWTGARLRGGLEKQLIVKTLVNSVESEKNRSLLVMCSYVVPVWSRIWGTVYSARMVLVHANYLQGYYDLLSFKHLVRVLWPIEHLNRHLGGVSSTLESFHDGNLKEKISLRKHSLHL